jgi:hypothetical protein
MFNDIGSQKITHPEPALSTVWAIEAIYHYPSFVLFVADFWTQRLYTYWSESSRIWTRERGSVWTATEWTVFVDDKKISSEGSWRSRVRSDGQAVYETGQASMLHGLEESDEVETNEKPEASADMSIFE